MDLSVPGMLSQFGHNLDIFTCTQRNLVSHMSVYTINTSIPVCDYCILFVQALLMFFCYNTKLQKFGSLTKMRSLWLIYSG